MVRDKKTAAVFCLTSNLTFAVASVMMDIKKNCPNLVDEIVIFHDQITKKDQKLLGKILPTRFVKYDFPIKDKSIFNQQTLKHFSHMVYAKYECFKLLEEYKKVLLLDYDIIIKSDISELLEPCESGMKLFMSSQAKLRENLHDGAKVEKYDLDGPSVSGAIFVLYDNLKNYKKLYDWCYEQTKIYAKELRFPEQAILSFMIQEFNLNPDMTSIDTNIYCCHPDHLEYLEKAKIVHSYGWPKFWSGFEGRFQSWHENYAAWLAVGGSKYYPKKSSLRKFWKKIQNFF